MQLVCGNSTITDEALSFILFLPLSNIYCSPTRKVQNFLKTLLTFLAAVDIIIRHFEVHGPWGCSSLGRALEWHSRGKGFDPPHLHHKKACRTNVLQAFFFCNVHTFVHTLNFIRQMRHRKVRPGNGTARRKSTFHECQSFGAYNAQRLS